MKISSAADLGRLIKESRLAANLTQVELANVSGTGTRFIIELEQGKPTCQLGKALRVAKMVGIRLEGQFISD